MGIKLVLILYTDMFDSTALKSKIRALGRSKFGFHFKAQAHKASRSLPPTVSLTLRFKIAQKPYIIRSLGPRIIKYRSLEP